MSLFEITIQSILVSKPSKDVVRQRVDFDYEMFTYDEYTKQSISHRQGFTDFYYELFTHTRFIHGAVESAHLEADYV